MTTEQLTFDLPPQPAMGRNDFIKAPCNKSALLALSDWGRWNGGRLALCGPARSGKSHLAQIFALESGAAILPAEALEAEMVPDLPLRVAIEDADRLFGKIAQQEALFHLYNDLGARGGRLLITGLGTPSQWPIVLPDLASRVQSMPLARLGPPDDDLLGALLAKLFHDRQIRPPEKLLPYLLARMERSFAAAHQLVAELDHRTLSEGRALNTALAGEVLESMANADL
ncbi:chromosomal replication initiator DnaA [Tropicimonas sp. S265A]|uniref:chromosomal replication initiator DnaA n=1 Tax=Tropicimonas sp. S265A TaxID=3415134 RepID=UPI003C7CFB2C